MTGLSSISHNPRFGAIFIEVEKKSKKRLEVSNIFVKDKSEKGFRNDEVVIYNYSEDYIIRHGNIAKAEEATLLTSPYTNTNNKDNTKQLKKLVREAVNTLNIPTSYRMAIKEFLIIDNRRVKGLYSRQFGDFTLYREG